MLINYVFFDDWFYLGVFVPLYDFVYHYFNLLANDIGAPIDEKWVAAITLFFLALIYLFIVYFAYKLLFYFVRFIFRLFFRG